MNRRPCWEGLLFYDAMYVAVPLSDSPPVEISQQHCLSTHIIRNTTTTAAPWFCVHNSNIEDSYIDRVLILAHRRPSVRFTRRSLIHTVQNKSKSVAPDGIP